MASELSQAAVPPDVDGVVIDRALRSALRELAIEIAIDRRDHQSREQR